MITKFKIYEAFKNTDYYITSHDIWNIYNNLSKEAIISDLTNDFLGWVKIKEDGEEDAIVHVVKYDIAETDDPFLDTKNIYLRFTFDQFEENGFKIPITTGDRFDFNLDTDFKIVKVEEFEPRRVVTEDDPYGEEIWENKTFDEKYDLDYVFSDCYEECDADWDSAEQVAEEKINNDLKGKFIRFIEGYGKAKYGRFKDIKIDTRSGGEIEDVDYYIWIKGNISRTPVSYDNHVIEILDGPEETTKPRIRWFNKGVLEGKEEYPFEKKYSLVDLVQPYFQEYESIDLDGFSRRLNRVFKGNWVEFMVVDDDGEDVGMREGLVQSVSPSYWYDPITDLEVEFLIDGVDYKVNPEVNVIVHSIKDKDIAINKAIDPYGEEEWDD